MPKTPTWTCDADVRARTDSFVLAKAVLTFTCSDGRTHVYPVEYVSDPSTDAIAKLARDQLAQLQRMDALTLAPVSGPVDLSPPAVPVVDVDPIAQAKQAAYADDVRTRIAQKNAIDLGILDPRDDEVQAVLGRLTTAVADPVERGAVLGLFG